LVCAAFYSFAPLPARFEISPSAGTPWAQLSFLSEYQNVLRAHYVSLPQLSGLDLIRQYTCDGNTFLSPFTDESLRLVPPLLGIGAEDLSEPERDRLSDVRYSRKRFCAWAALLIESIEAKDDGPELRRLAAGTFLRTPVIPDPCRKFSWLLARWVIARHLPATSNDRLIFLKACGATFEKAAVLREMSRVGIEVDPELTAWECTRADYCESVLPTIEPRIRFVSAIAFFAAFSRVVDQIIADLESTLKDVLAEEVALPSPFHDHAGQIEAKALDWLP
jgi:hypothetical protein